MWAFDNKGEIRWASLLCDEKRLRVMLQNISLHYEWRICIESHGSWANDWFIIVCERTTYSPIKATGFIPSIVVLFCLCHGSLWDRSCRDRPVKTWIMGTLADKKCPSHSASSFLPSQQSLVHRSQIHHSPYPTCKIVLLMNSLWRIWNN